MSTQYAPIWNDAGRTFTCLKANVTDTASDASSLLMDLQVGGGSKFSIGKNSILSLGLFDIEQSTSVITTFKVNSTDILTITNQETRFLKSVGFSTLPGTSADLKLERDAADILALRRSTNPQTFRIYNTYTNDSDYERASLKWDSNLFKIGTESLGTGTARDVAIINNGNVVANFLSDRFYLGPVSDGTTVGGNARGQFSIDLSFGRSNAANVASNARSVCIGYDVQATGNGNGTVAIGNGAKCSDSIGGAVAIGKSTTTGYRGVAIGNSTAAADGIAIGTASNAAYGANVCFAGTQGLFSGHILFHGSYSNKAAGTSYLYAITHYGGDEIGTISIRTTNDTQAILQSQLKTGYSQQRHRHKGVISYEDFTILATRSDGAVCKWSRRVFVKSLANAAGTSYTYSLLATETMGTDIVEISGASIEISLNGGNTELKVTGEPAYAATGDASTDIITAIGHPFANDDIVVFTSLTGGSGLTANPVGEYFKGIYKVINVSGDTFQLTSSGSSTTPIDFTTDITDAVICRPITWSKVAGRFAANVGGY